MILQQCMRNGCEAVMRRDRRHANATCEECKRKDRLLRAYKYRRNKRNDKKINSQENY